MSYHARTILTPGASRKRKERESFYASAAALAASAAAAATATKPAARPAQAHPQAQAQAQAAAKEGPAEPPVMSDNRLLAGYMAHEFLMRGTLLGAMPESSSAAARGDEQPPPPPKQQQQQQQQTEGKKPSGSYGEVASILKADGVHVPGILNPSQLARWIQM